ncbi:MAG: hypothetical protein RL338_1680 [Chloroflexota bacterium]|jgi:hypothetical membrane protein
MGGRLVRLERIAPLVGLAGAAALAAGSVVAAVAYRGASGEPYSPLNHWVSELGMPSVSALAAVFNAGVIAGGAAFVVFMVAVGRARGGILGGLTGAFGAAAGVAGMGVGVFNADMPSQHMLAALAFFWLGGVAIAAVSISIVRRRDERFPAWLAIPGAVAFVSFYWFLALFYTRTVGAYATPLDRPAVWLITVVEWLVIVALLGWVALASITWRRATAGVAVASPVPSSAVAAEEAAG